MTRKARPLRAPGVSSAGKTLRALGSVARAEPGPAGATTPRSADAASVPATGAASEVPGLTVAEGTERGVKRIFTKGEIMPIVTPLENAKPAMRSAVRISLPRYGLR